jgi:hypothetical protein
MSRRRALEAAAPLAPVVAAVLLALAATDEPTGATFPVIFLSAGAGSLPAVELGGAGHGASPIGDGAVRLHANGTLGHRLELSDAVRVVLSADARGTEVAGTGPLLELRVDGHRVAGFHVAHPAWTTFRAPLRLAAGEHVVQWSFVNDAAAYPERRDLDLLQVEVQPAGHATAGRPRWRAPCMIDPRRTAFRAYGRVEGSGFRLWNGGWLGDDVVIPRDGSHAVRVRLDERSPGGVLEVWVDGEHDADLELPAGCLGAESRLALGAGIHRVEWRYRGREAGAEADHDLVLFEIRLGDPVTAPRAAERLVLRGESLEIGRADTPSSAPGRPWALRAGDYVAHTLVAPGAGTWSLRVRARAEPCERSGLYLLVIRDEDQLARLSVDSAAGVEYRVPLALDPGANRVFIVHDVDPRRDAACSGPVYVDRLALDRTDG